MVMVCLVIERKMMRFKATLIFDDGQTETEEFSSLINAGDNLDCMLTEVDDNDKYVINPHLVKIILEPIK